MTEQKPQRYWLVPATGFANAHMEPADDGEWVRFDAARATPAAPEALQTQDEARRADIAADRTWASGYAAGRAAAMRAASPAAPETAREVPAWLEHTIDTLERGGGSVAYISIEHLREVRAALDAAPEPSGIAANGERRAWDDPDFATWTCTIAGPYRGELEPGSDLPMRRAVAEAYAAVTGHPEAHLWSGWNGHARPLVQPAANEPPEDFGESGPTWVRP